MIKKHYQAFSLFVLFSLLTACSSCATLNIFGTDPVGASLVTMRNGYESVITETGQAYKSGAINKDQLNNIVVVGRNFHSAYVLAVNAHLLKDEQDTEKYRLQAAAVLAQLTDLARNLFGYGGVMKGDVK